MNLILLIIGTLIIFLLSMLGLSIGIITKGKPLHGRCTCKTDDKDSDTCENRATCSQHDLRHRGSDQ